MKNQNILRNLLLAVVVLLISMTAKTTAKKHEMFHSPGKTVYYIDSKKGSDDNNGTSPEKAWKSLDRVNNVIFAPGDKILFKAGTNYKGQLKPQGSGKDGSPIVIDKYGQGGKPRIDGEGQVLDTLLLENVQYWEVNNLEITNLGPKRVNWRTGVRVLANNRGTLRHIAAASFGNARGRPHRALTTC
jgi:hypothetical protein